MSTEPLLLTFVSIGIALGVGIWLGVLYSKKRWLIPQLKEIEDRMEAKAQDSLKLQSRKFSAMIPDIMSDIHVIADEMEAGVHSLMDRLEMLSDRTYRDVGQTQQSTANHKQNDEEGTGDGVE